jgi:formate dehydrogenase assembly factor FdhD
MNKYLLLLPALWMAVGLVAQPVFRAPLVRFEATPILEENFRAYEVVRLDADAIHALVSEQGLQGRLSVQFGEHPVREFALYRHSILSPDYRSWVSTPRGVEELPFREIGTYRGYETSDPGGTLSLTIEPGFFFGFWRLGGQEWFVEPLYRMVPEAGRDLYLLYRSSDVLERNNFCGVSITEQRMEEYHEQEKSLQVNCFTIDIALAADFSMVTALGSVSQVLSFMAGVLNNVQTNYDNEFNVQYQFSTLTTFVSTCSTCDPWTTSTDGSNVLLPNFRTWGNNNGFGTLAFDVASFWSNRDFDGSTVGWAYVGAACGTSRYNILQNYTNNATSLRVLQAHELGHNFSASHDADGAGTIMAPAVNNTTTWSTQSLTQINNHLSARHAPGCLAGCNPPSTNSCSNPITITCGQLLITGTTSGAAQSVPNCGGLAFNTSPGIWYRYTASLSGTVTLSTCNPLTNFDTKIVVYTGTCSNLTCHAAGDDSNCSSNNGLSTILSFSVTAGQSYLIYVTGFQAQTGNFQLTISCFSSNINCATPTTITCGQTITATTSGAAQNVPNCGGFEFNTAGGLWYRYTANQTGTVTVSTCNPGTNFDTKIAVYTGPCNNLSCLAGIDDGCSPGFSSIVQFPATAGLSYSIYVTGYQAQTGNFQLSLTCTAPPSLVVNTSSVSQVASGGQTNFTITSNCASWTITGAPTWASVSPTSGSNNATVTVNFQANTSTQSRDATLTITGCGITRTVSLSQAGAAPTLNVSTSNINQSAAGGQSNFSISSNCSAWAITGMPTWVSVSPSSGLNNASIVVNFQPNTSTQSRSATITVSGCSITRSINLSQDGAAFSLEVSPNSINQIGAGSSTISVTSNCNSWTVSGAPTWLSVSPTSGSNNGSVTLNFQANTASQPRSASLNITGCGITRTVTITQAAAPLSLELDASSLTQTGGGGPTSFGVISNCSSWSVTGAPSWFSVSPTTGSNNGTVTLNVQANPSIQARSANLTVSGCGITRTISVTQLGADPSLEVNPATISQTAAGGPVNFSVFSNCTFWSISGAPLWVTFNPLSGSGNGQVTVIFEANPIAQPRTATFSITGCGITRTVTISQTGTAVSMEVNPEAIIQTAAGGPANVWLITNCNFWSVSGGPTWVIVTPPSGSNSELLALNFEPNTSTQSRSGTITIVGCGISRTISLTQTGASINLELSPATINQTQAGGQASFSVSSNCSSWTITGVPAWATVTPLSGSNTGTITINFQPNNTTQLRSATLTVSGCGISRSLGLTQSGTANNLEVNPTLINQPATAGTATLAVSGNCNAWTITGAPAWATVTPLSGSNTGTITIAFQANTATQLRSATLNISGCGITRAVTITQSGSNTVDIPWTRSPTGTNHIIIAQASIMATLNGIPLVAGDAIGFFFEHNGMLHCSNYLVLNGQSQSLAVYGNDATAPNKNGFAAGESFKIKIYKASTQQVFDAQANFAPAGTVIPPLTITHTHTFDANGISLLLGLSASSNSSLRIPLSTGWNMISSYITPLNTGMPAVFSGLNTVVEIVKDAAGNSYLPVFNINNLGNWEMTKGYQVRSAQDTAVTITGTPVNPATTPVPITTGWQIIPYLRSQAAPITQQLAGIVSITELVKDNLGVNIYIPGLINTIGDMRPGQGYQLKAIAPGTLTYTANQLWSDTTIITSAATTAAQSAPVFFPYHQILKSNQNSTLIITAPVAGAIMEAGDELGVFTADGMLCGAAVFEHQHFAITIWGDDPATPAVREGLLAGESYQLRIWKKQQNTVLDITPVFERGDQIYNSHDVDWLAGLSIPSVIKEIHSKKSTLTVFPNPVEDRCYVIVPANIATLEVYDTKGAVVYRVFHPLPGPLLLETADFPRGLLHISAVEKSGHRWSAKVIVP